MSYGDGSPHKDLGQDPEPSNLEDVRAKGECLEATGSRGGSRTTTLTTRSFLYSASS